MATKKVNRNYALEIITAKTPAEKTMARRRLQRQVREIKKLGQYFEGQVEVRLEDAKVARHDAKIKLLCAGVLRTNGYKAEAKELVAEAKKLERDAKNYVEFAEGYPGIARDCYKRADELANSPARLIDESIDEAVKEGRLTSTMTDEGEMIGLPEWGPAPGAATLVQ